MMSEKEKEVIRHYLFLTRRTLSDIDTELNQENESADHLLRLASNAKTLVENTQSFLHLTHQIAAIKP